MKHSTFICLSHLPFQLKDCQRGRYNALKILIVIFLFACGCGRGAAESVETFDAGIVTNDIVYGCLLNGVENKTVQAVVTSCGCTAVDVENGQVLDKSRPFMVRISLEGRPAEVGSQTFYILFEDKTKVFVNIRYDYRPLPSCAPRCILFGESDAIIAVTFSFPGEKDAEIVKTTCPDFIKCTIGPKNKDHVGEIIATFSCNRREMKDAHKGVIWIGTNSERMPKFGIPFLWLDN